MLGRKFRIRRPSSANITWPGDAETETPAHSRTENRNYIPSVKRKIHSRVLIYGYASHKKKEVGRDRERLTFTTMMM